MINTSTLSITELAAQNSCPERIVGMHFLYPVTTSVLLGAAWYVAFMVRRRLWLASVSGGWYAAAVGQQLENTDTALTTGRKGRDVMT